MLILGILMIENKRITEEQISFIPDRQQERIKARKMKQKKRRQKRIIFFIILTLIILVAALIGIIDINSKSDLNAFEGTWIYDAYTSYEFDGKGNGCMRLEELSYEYTYTVQDDELKINFKDNSVRDCTYTFSIKDDTLTIIGGEGTVGGTYELHKVQ